MKNFLLLAGGAVVVACSTTATPAAPTPTPTTASTDAGTATSVDPTPDELAKRGTCPASSGTGTTHGDDVTADETWTAAASPHRITSSLSILATLTVEPCAVVLLDEGVTLTVGSTSVAGSLVGHGTSQLVDGVHDVRPVTFDASDATKGWDQLAVQPKGTLDLAVAAMQNGGHASSGEAGALLVRGVAGGTNDGEPTPSTKLDRVLIEKSAAYGANMVDWGAFAAGSTKVWIRDGGSAAYPYPVRLEPGIAATLPTNLVVSGNVKDEILLLTSKTFMRSDTLVNRGIPYHQRGALYVNPSTDASPVKLTIEAGVTLGFEVEVGSGMYIGSSDTRQGILEAVGTAAAPIVFTSAKDAKAPGDWMSLYFKSTPKTGSHVSYARVEYAGADSTTSGGGCGPGDNDAAVYISGTGTSDGGPDSAFIDHTTFDQIGGTTVIVSAWVDDAGPNFSPSNTFGPATPSCKVSKPRRTGAGDVCDGDRTNCWP